MRRVTRYIALCLALFLYIGGCTRDRSFWHWLYETHIVADDYRFGDLYRLSSLPQFKDPSVICPALTPTPTSDWANLHVYLIGDSFSEVPRITARDIPAQRYNRTHWEGQQRVQLDPAARNILVLESVERHIREHVAQPVRNLTVVADTTLPQPKPGKPWRQQLAEFIQAKGIDERLETLLFSQDVFGWCKEVKAWVNQQFFNRVNPGVSLSANGQHLFTSLDTDTSRHDAASGLPRAGSFTPLTDGEVAQMVDSLNATATYYRQQGFDAVYMTLIPNKASIENRQPGAYNHLIERIQQHPALRVPFIDSYTPFKNSRQPVYALGDSHWNCTGRAIWLRAVQSRLQPYAPAIPEPLPHRQSLPR